MNRLKSMFAKRISRYAQRKGIDIQIGDISFTKGILLEDTCIRIQEGKVLVHSIHINLSIKALFRKMFSVTMLCKGTTLISEHISEKEFVIENTECKLHFDKSLNEIVSDIRLNQETKLSLRYIKNPTCREFFFKAKDLSIDEYKKIFNGHILSQFMRTIHSDDRITILCYYKYDKVTPYPKINSAFQYDSLTIQPSNYILSKEYIIEELNKRNHLANDYKRYEDIPEIIRRTVMCTEDPSFELHKGISPVLMGLTLRTNINQRKLGRGGSSISMQLVKNALLNGERTICRKIEEAILTLLMENYYHVCKQDLLEIYLNMIEFAPNVYGIEDAAKFYFGKSSSELSIVEVITLTYIIPRPIHFYEALLLKTDQLQKNLNNHIKHYLNVTQQKKIFDPELFHSINVDRITFTDKFGTLSLKP